MISILGAMAEIERDNISVQTMAGRREKARQGGWNGGIAPYGYVLAEGDLKILPEEAEQIRIIFDKYVHTNLGFTGIARWLNEHGYKKTATTHNSLDVFTESFIEKVINNHTYCGKIAYGKSKTVLRDGSDDEYHRVETDDYMIHEGRHEPIITEEVWEAAQAKKKANGGRKEPIDKEHQYIYSALLKCPICGKSMYGVPSRGKRRKKDGSLYPTYYAYMCRSGLHVNGIECGFGQVSCSKIDKAMAGIISQIVNGENFGGLMSELVNEQISTAETEQELDTAIKAHRQVLGLQRKLESELDKLDVMDKHYDRKYESLSRRLDDAFDAIEAAEKKVADCEARLESVKRRGLTKKSVYESLKLFDECYDSMNDFEKKSFVNTFIDSIELYPDKKQREGSYIKTVHFKFPVAYNGEPVYDISPRKATTDETVCLLSKLSEAKHHIEVKVDMDELDLTSAEAKATYKEIQDWVQEKYGFHVTNLNIAQVKQKHGIIERENYNKPKTPDSKQPGCPEDKIKAIEDAMRNFQMI